MKPRIVCTTTAAEAFKVIEAEYLRQLAALAMELKPGFVFGAFGADTGEFDDKQPSPYWRLCEAVKERVKTDPQVLDLIRVASPNRWQAIDPDWVDDRTAVVEAVVVDLCVIAEAQGWTKPRVAASYRRPGDKRSPVRPVPVSLPSQAA